MKPRIILGAVIMLSMTILSSCWNYKDVETVAIAAGLAIDKDEETNQFIVTIELINQQSSDKEVSKQSRVIESEGDTIFDAVRDAVMKIGKKIFWGHCKVIVISEAISREGIVPVIDWAERDSETRPDVWVLVSRANTAKEILEVALESGEIRSFVLDETINSVDAVSKFVSEDFTELVLGLENKTISKVLPTVFLDDKNKMTKVSGSAVLNEDKVVYFLNADESKIALLIMNQLKGGLLTFSEDVSKEQIKITLEIFKSKTKLEPKIQENSIYINIDTKIDVGIAEVEGRENFIEKSKREEIIKHIEKIIENQILELVKKTQLNYSTDIFDFGGTIQRKMPKYWKEIEANWDEVYPMVEIIPSVEVNMIGSAFSVDTIEKGD